MDVPTDEFRLFCRAVGKHAAETIAGVGFSAAGLIWQIVQWVNPRAQAPTFRPWMLFIPGVGLLFRATYHAWRDEHRTRVEAQSRIRKDRSDFSAYINLIAFEDPVASVVAAYFLVSVENIGGSPSILHHWRAYVLPPDKLESEVTVRHPGHGEDFSLIIDDSGNEVLINESEFISEKAYVDAVRPGHSVRGFLCADIPEGLPERTRFIIRFWDADKRTYECEYDTSVRRDRARDISALDNWPGVVIRHRRVPLTER